MDFLPSTTSYRCIVDAWDRSHFLFDTAVTQYLRQIWKDALEAENAYRIVSGEEQGDRDDALKQKRVYTEKYFEDESSEKLRSVFMKEIKLQPRPASRNSPR